MSLTVGWVFDHYQPGTHAWICRRCQQEVTYVTKHAAARHGDPIDVVPVAELVNPDLARLW